MGRGLRSMVHHPSSIIFPCHAKSCCIDDEPQITEICRDYLKAANYDVIIAHDGKEGLALARREKPDLIVLDLMLPEMERLRCVPRSSQRK